MQVPSIWLEDQGDAMNPTQQRELKMHMDCDGIAAKHRRVARTLDGLNASSIHLTWLLFTKILSVSSGSM